MGRRARGRPRGLTESQSFSFFGETSFAASKDARASGGGGGGGGGSSRSTFMVTPASRRRASDDGRLPALNDERYVGPNAMVLLQTLTGGYRHWVGGEPGAKSLSNVLTD